MSMPANRPNADVILIVDDNTVNLKVVIHSLHTCGLETAIARNGQRGLERAERLHPALILLDLNLPDIDGFEVCRRLKSNPATADIPVIFMTVSSDVRDKVQGFAVGAVDYIIKPVQYDELLARVRTHLKLCAIQHQLEAHNARLANEIAQRTRIETALRENEERYQGLFDTMRSGVAVYDAVDDGADFVFKDFNRAAEFIEGVHREEILGKRLSEAFPGAKEFGLFDVLRRVWRTGRREYLAPRIYRDARNPGTWRENWVYKLPNGELVTVYTDVTGWKQLELTLRQAKAEAEAASKTKSEFLAHISHELRTPLNIILGMAQIMQHSESFPAVHAEHLDSLINSGQHLLLLINRLIEISRVESDPFSRNGAQFDFHQLIADIEAQERQLAGGSEEDTSIYVQRLQEVLTPTAFAALPDDLRNTLREAAEMADVELAKSLIVPIQTHNAALAEALTEVLKNYRFDMLQAVFDTRG